MLNCVYSSAVSRSRSKADEWTHQYVFVAQLVEQLTFNQLVAGSSPAEDTNLAGGLSGLILTADDAVNKSRSGGYMKNIIDILKEIGVEVPQEHVEQLNRLVAENYRTIADYDKVVRRRDELKTSLDDVTAKLEGFRDVDVTQLNAQIQTLTNELAAEKAARTEDAAKAVRERNVRAFLADKKFVNDITRASIERQLLDALAANTGETVDQLYSKITTGDDGQPIPNIVVDDQTEQLERNRARFTEGKGSGTPSAPVTLASMTLDERIRMKREKPEEYKRLKENR